MMYDINICIFYIKMNKKEQENWGNTIEIWKTNLILLTFCCLFFENRMKYDLVDFLCK